MALTERQNEILRKLKENKTAVVSELAQDLFVSEATIRRDLAEMKSMGLIERSHGGALLPENAEEISIFFRMEKNASEKIDYREFIRAMKCIACGDKVVDYAIKLGINYAFIQDGGACDESFIPDFDLK